MIAEKLKAAGIEESVLDPGSKDLMQGIENQTLARRAALKKGFRPLGYPTMAFPCFMYQDACQEILAAAALMTKYAGIIVIRQTSVSSCCRCWSSGSTSIRTPGGP